MKRLNRIGKCSIALSLLAVGIWGNILGIANGSGFELSNEPLRMGGSKSYDSLYETENVIILVIDGLRNSEAFDDPHHQYIPHIWNDLRPRGTIYTQFYTTAWTMTTHGHMTLLTGTRFNLNLTFGLTSDNYREYRPTIFEAYRKDLGVPQDKTWIVSGKQHLSTTDHSLHPFWGEDYRANLEYDFASDAETMQYFYRIANEDHPSLALINLRYVDEVAHRAYNDYDDYLATIVQADSLVYDLWQRLQMDPYYQGKTTLIVTSDHGRYAGEREYREHGGPDHSNRHIIFLALGPDIEQGLEVSTRGDLIDIPVTVAELLGFSMPYAEGRVLHEMLVAEPSTRPDPPPENLGSEVLLSNTPGSSVYPSIEANSDGLHVVWSEQDTSSDEEHRLILYRNSDDFNMSWENPDTLLGNFTYYSSESDFLYEEMGTPISATIRSKEDGTLMAAVSGYSIGYFDEENEDKELLWGVNLLSRAPEGEWIEQGFSNKGYVIANAPGLTAKTPEAWVAWTDGTLSLSLGYEEPRDDILPRAFVSQFQGDRPGGPFFGTPSIDRYGDYVHLAYVIQNKWMIYARFNTLSSELEDTTFFDRESTSPSLLPRITVEEEDIHIVWAEYENDVWGIRYRKSTDGGQSFGEIVSLSSSAAGALHPDIAVDGQTVVVMWEDYRDGNGEIYGIMSPDGGNTWGQETRFTWNDSFSAFPRVAGYQGRFYMAWQDDRGGNWEVYFLEL